jgi:MFS family permease
MFANHSMQFTKIRLRIIEFLALRRSTSAALIMAVLVGMGERIAERFLPLFLLSLGGGSLSVGLLNGMQNLLSALYSLPGGYISGRYGYKKALLLFNLAAMTGYVIVILANSWKTVLLGTVFFIAWSAISLPATMHLISEVLPKYKRTMAVSLHSLVRRIPMALGPIAGGILISLFGISEGIRIAFVVAFFMAATALILQQFMIRENLATPGKAPALGLTSSVLMNPSLKNLLVSDILIRFCEQIPYAFVVIWCVKLQRITPLQFSYLTAIEMATAFLIYIPVAYWADKTAKKPFVMVTFLFFTFFPLALFFTRSFQWMVFAFILRGLKEFGEPTRKALIMDLAPEGLKAETFGIYYLIRDVLVSLAAFGGALLWDGEAAKALIGHFQFTQSLIPFFMHWASPETNLLTAFVCGLAGSIFFWKYGKDLLPAGTIGSAEDE